MRGKPSDLLERAQGRADYAVVFAGDGVDDRQILGRVRLAGHALDFLFESLLGEAFHLRHAAADDDFRRIKQIDDGREGPGEMLQPVVDELLVAILAERVVDGGARMVRFELTYQCIAGGGRPASS